MNSAPGGRPPDMSGQIHEMTLPRNSVRPVESPNLIGIPPARQSLTQRSDLCAIIDKFPFRPVFRPVDSGGDLTER